MRYLLFSAMGVGCVLRHEELGIITLILLSGPFIAVPLALPIVEDRLGGDEGLGWIRLLHAASAIAVAASCFASGWPAVALALIWVGFSVALTVVALFNLIAWSQTFPALLRLIASGYLVIGAVWLVASRAQVTPLGFHEPIVQLTAAHFHFAGFGAVLVASCVAAAYPSVSHRVAYVFASVVAIAPVVVAIGHLTVPIVELIGGAVSTVGLFGLAYATWKAPIHAHSARVIARCCSFVVVLPMALALQYGWAEAVGVEHLPYNTIAGIHGSLNALGFVCGSLLAWRLEQRASERD